MNERKRPPGKAAHSHHHVYLPSESLAADATKPRPGLTGEQFVAKLKRVRRSSNGWECRCPAHDDRTPSLSVADGVEGVVFHCHAMCTPDEVLKAMGLEWWQLFYWSEAEHKRAYEAATAQAFGIPVHSGRFSVGEGIESWRERRRSFVHRLELQLPDFDWELLDAALNYETPDEGMTVAQGKLGKQFGYSQSTVSRRLVPMVEAGLLKSEARSRKGKFAVSAGPGRTSNRYRLDTNRIALLLKAVKTKAKEVGARALRRSPHVDEMASALITLTRLESFLFPDVHTHGDGLVRASECVHRRRNRPNSSDAISHDKGQEVGRGWGDASRQRRLVTTMWPKVVHSGISGATYPQSALRSLTPVIRGGSGLRPRCKP